MTVETHADFKRLGFSNFEPTPVSYDGMEYPTVEHAYQAAKTLDIEDRRKIQRAATTGAAKRLGRTVALRPDWEVVKLPLMRLFLRFKFNREPYRSNLLTTTGLIVEANTWHDNIWGDCTCQRCAGRPGRNLLGRSLMAIREELRACR